MYPVTQQTPDPLDKPPDYGARGTHEPDTHQEGMDLFVGRLISSSISKILRFQEHLPTYASLYEQITSPVQEVNNRIRRALEESSNINNDMSVQTTVHKCYVFGCGISMQKFFH
jgi:hypothetical protein